jgi:arylsulfatase A-like enzyme
MKPLTPSLIFALALLATTCGPPRGSKAGDATGVLAGRPIVLLLFDAYSANHISHLGYPLSTSPNLDALAAEGISFASNFAPAPYTLASIPSLFTSKLPDHHGVTSVDRALSNEETTLAEVLQSAGYGTFGAIANIKGGAMHNFGQGFDVFRELYKDGTDTMKIVDPALFAPLFSEWAEERETGRPFFFYAHVLEPHMPYAPPKEHRDLWLDPGYDGPYKNGLTKELVTDFAAAGGRLQESQAGDDESMHISHEDKLAIKGLYDANIHYADSILGDILATLEEAGILDEALIIVTSDHGESMWEHGQLGHSYQVFDEVLRVPMVIRFPKDIEPAVPRGTVLETMTSNMDLLPSLCAWLDLPPPADIDGIPFAGLFGAGPSSARQLFLRANQPDPVRGLRGERLKAVHQPATPTSEAVNLLFNLKKDPGESTNQRDTRSRFGDDLLEQLEKRLQALRDTGSGAINAAEATSAEAALIHDIGYAE